MSSDARQFLRRMIGSVSGSGSPPVDASATSATAESSSVKAPPDTSTKTDPTRLISDFLQMEGCSPSIDSDGDVRFRYHELTMCVILDRKDAEYVRVVLPNIWSIDSPKELACVQAVADRVNRSCKSAKVFTVKSAKGENVWVSIEMFLPSAGHVCPVLMRCAASLERSAHVFSAGMALD